MSSDLPEAPALGGTLISSHFVAHGLWEVFAGRLGESTRAASAARFARWWRRCEAAIGPATAVRTIGEAWGGTLFGLLGYRLSELHVEGTRSCALAAAITRDGQRVPVLVVSWGDDLDRRWREAVLESRAGGSRWSFCWNARELRIVDAARPWSRRFASFDLASCAIDEDAFGLLWALARAEALVPPRARGHRAATSPVHSLLDEVVGAASASTDVVCARLEHGVRAALVRLVEEIGRAAPRTTSATSDVLLHESLTVVYRVLFLLFAEARSLVPLWHRTYRDGYSLGALQDALEGGGEDVGLWAAIQAISRLAHDGCEVGALRVTPFNGHLFSPVRAPLADRVQVRDHVMRDVLIDLTTTPVRARGRVRISFADLGVEQLGAVYERVLDHRLVVERRARVVSARLVAHRGERKASATFYTPRALTDLIVRRTLAPLVDGASSERILALRVLDPAMGSGAFLVAACQYLSRAYEAAIVREQQLGGHEVDARDRAGFRRLIARRCLYGVDLNPMAVQLARLSLWLATLAADVPLTFLDHHLRVGNSLLGASLDDLLRQSPGRPRGRGNAPLDSLPLLVATDAMEAFETAAPLRGQLADAPDDTVAQVRAKESLLASLEARGAPLARWREAADLWCAAWFTGAGTRGITGALYRELLAVVLGRGGSLRASELEDLLGSVRDTARRERFFHWTFEFPEVFHQATGGASPGFDAVIGNPPWDMVREDGADAHEPRVMHRLAAFVKQSGIYAGAVDSHLNLYLLFVERAMQVLRIGGRLGLVVPWGLAADHGAARARRALLDGCALDSCIAIDNRRALFPIHRSLKFAVLTGTRGSPTRTLPLTHVPGEAAAIDRRPERAEQDDDGRVSIPRELLATVSGATLAVPDIRSTEDLRLLERLWHVGRPLASRDGWDVHFGRELNATDDRDLFRPVPPGAPVIDGKHVEPFRVDVSRAGRFADAAQLRRRLPTAPFDTARVAYRDVASASNQRTLIAAVVPEGVVTTHTLFCCRTALADDAQHALCAVLNSFVANWIVRRWVSTHVTVALVERIPVPIALMRHRDVLAAQARRLAQVPDRARQEIEARLQGLLAWAWGVTRAELELVLQDFPLIDQQLARETLRAFEARAMMGPPCA